MIKDSSVAAYVKTCRTVTVEQLCKKFNISASTARRVLERLEKKGELKRFRGGANALGSSTESSIMNRFTINESKKKLIAQKAASLIPDNSTIILLGGSTVHYICQYLNDKNLTVITNSMLVLNQLRIEKNIRVILLGGVFDSKEEEVCGPLTNLGLKNIRADFMFMGTSGFNEKQGFITHNMESIELYQSCIEASMNAVVVCDSTKYGSSGLGITAKLTDIDLLITDDGLPESICDTLREHGLKLEVVGIRTPNISSNETNSNSDTLLRGPEPSESRESPTLVNTKI